MARALIVHDDLTRQRAHSCASAYAHQGQELPPLPVLASIRKRFGRRGLETAIAKICRAMLAKSR
eukprot:6805623-Lingulodinium_polyedra.AAC.1